VRYQQSDHDTEARYGADPERDAEAEYQGDAECPVKADQYAERLGVDERAGADHADADPDGRGE
jgi:hypothetical protein